MRLLGYRCTKCGMLYEADDPSVVIETAAHRIHPDLEPFRVCPDDGARLMPQHYSIKVEGL